MDLMRKSCFEFGFRLKQMQLTPWRYGRVNMNNAFMKNGSMQCCSGRRILIVILTLIEYSEQAQTNPQLAIKELLLWLKMSSSRFHKFFRTLNEFLRLIYDKVHKSRHFRMEYMHSFAIKIVDLNAGHVFGQCAFGIETQFYATVNFTITIFC